MIIGVLKEARSGETRVAATPATVGKLVKLGYDVVVEPGAGAASSFPDEAYVEAGRDDRRCGDGRRRVRCERAVVGAAGPVEARARRWSAC